MKLLNEIFSGAWSEALVWTLIHSLWQGLAALILVITALRIIPSRHSSVRYILATGALLIFFVSSVSTYILLYDSTSEPTAIMFNETANVTSHIIEPVSENLMMPFLSTVYSFVESNLYLIACVWMSGAFLFSLRMVSGFFYISAIKRNAIPLGEEWRTLIQDLSGRIGLHKKVVLSESTGIQVPFVVGFIKPIILMPVGMMSGLSMQQLESILVHELMHIKRNDYIVNVIQSVIESVFFFNPFVWVISSVIRREREHCCDDEVVKYGDPLSYAFALTRLEELNLKQASPALSLAENRNQLLNRIKRIMEKSVQNYSVKERIVPVVLLVVGLICASWFSIIPANAIDNDESLLQVAGDTTKSKKTPKAHSKKKITATDREGNPVEYVETQVEDELRESDHEFELATGYDLSIPPIPPIPPVEPFEPFAPLPLPGVPVPPMAPFPPMVGGYEFMFEMDSVPPGMSRREWEAFSRDFQLKFKEKFGDFYKKHGDEMDKMMKEMGDEFKTSFNEEWVEKIQEEAQRSREHALNQMQEARAAMERDEQFHDQHQRMAEQGAHQAQTHQQMLKQHEQDLIRHQKEMQIHEEKMKKFDEELKDELIKDGYLGKDESISNMHWKRDGTIEINGKDIKEEHRQKYQDLHRKHFKERGSFHYVD